MEQSKQDVKLGKFLSLVLRHNPAAAYIQLDSHGWVDTKELLAGCARTGMPIDQRTLERIVQKNSKQRYSFNDDHTKIRANQGHSVSVDLDLREMVPSARLYHGTAACFLSSIRAQGIIRQSRQHVHLSADWETAWKVGSRHGKPVILTVNALAMTRDGYRFYRSENGVWLCGHVPWRYVLEDGISYEK